MRIYKKTNGMKVNSKRRNKVIRNNKRINPKAVIRGKGCYEMESAGVKGEIKVKKK